MSVPSIGWIGPFPVLGPMVEPVALVALAIDALVGWPTRVHGLVGHPVGAFARFIDWTESRWNRASDSEAVRRLAGIALMLALIGLAAGVAIGLEWRLRLLAGPWAWIGVALLAWPGLAVRSLNDHVRAVADALTRDDMPGARQAVAMIVGRDTGMLDEAGIARAGIESLAESFCDGVVAPLFWLAVAGLPGIWAYKAINTADSLIGHREARWRAFGWCAARVDDVANLVPARLAAVLLCLAGARGWRVMWRDCRRHASPNAGWPEAAMAGAVGIRLAGPSSYDGVAYGKPWIGAEGREACADDMGRALAIYRRSCLLLAALAGGAAWLP